jgi:hypothetical protein
MVFLIKDESMDKLIDKIFDPAEDKYHFQKDKSSIEFQNM